MWQRESHLNLKATTSGSGNAQKKGNEEEDGEKIEHGPEEGKIEEEKLEEEEEGKVQESEEKPTLKQESESMEGEEEEAKEADATRNSVDPVRVETPRTAAIKKRPELRKRFSRKRGRIVVARRLEHKLRELKAQAKSEALEMQSGAKAVVEGVYSKRRNIENAKAPITIFHISWLIYVWMPASTNEGKDSGWVEAQAQTYDALHGVLEVVYGESFVRSPRARSGIYVALGKVPVRLVRPLEMFEDQFDADIAMTPRSLEEENNRLFYRVKRLLSFLVSSCVLTLILSTDRARHLRHNDTDTAAKLTERRKWRNRCVAT